MIVKAIKYGADWCQPCKLMESNLKAANIPFTTVDIDDEEQIAEEKHITTVPYIEFYDEHDNLVKTHVGILTVEQLKKL